VTVLRALLRWWRADALVFAGSLAFLSLLAIAPALASAFWLAEQNPVLKTGEKALRAFLYTHLLPDAAGQATALLDRLRANARGLGELAIGLMALDLAVKSLAIHVAFDRIFRVRARGLIAHLRGGVVLLVVLPVVVGGLYWLLLTTSRLLTRTWPAAKGAVTVVAEPLQYALPLFVALTLLYRYVPAHVRGWRSPVASALLITAAIELARWALSAYVADLAALRSLYGTFIAAPLLLLSLLLTWALVLIGAALTAEHFGTRRPDRAERRQPGARPSA